MKNFKKITASIAAAALCAVSAMSTAINANAATVQNYSTYRTYFYYNASLDKTSAVDSVEVSFFAYNSCPVTGPGSHGPARTYGCLNNVNWEIYGSGSQYGELGIMKMTRANKKAKRQSGMLCKVVTEAKSKGDHTLAWAIGDESNKNKGCLVEYSYKIRDDKGNLLFKSANSQYEAKAYEDSDTSVLQNPLCVKAFTVRIGDVNNDGKVNTTDKNLVNAISKNSNSNPDYHNKKSIFVNINNVSTLKYLSYFAADINGDGKVDNADVTLLDNYLKGYQRLADCQYS